MHTPLLKTAKDAGIPTGMPDLAAASDQPFTGSGNYLNRLSGNMGEKFIVDVARKCQVPAENIYLPKKVELKAVVRREFVFIRFAPFETVTLLAESVVPVERWNSEIALFKSVCA